MVAPEWVAALSRVGLLVALAGFLVYMLWFRPLLAMTRLPTTSLRGFERSRAWATVGMASWTALGSTAGVAAGLFLALSAPRWAIPVVLTWLATLLTLLCAGRHKQLTRAMKHAAKGPEARLVRTARLTWNVSLITAVIAVILAVVPTTAA